MTRQLSLAAALVATLALASCNANQTASAAPATAPATTTTSKPKLPFFETTGPVTVENQVEVLAQRDGVIANVVADADTYVKAGQLLATMDDRQLMAERDAATAKVGAISADLKNFEADQKIVEIDLSRDEELFANKLITQKQLDHSRTRVEGVKFEVERERQDLLNAQATLKALELELEKTHITAPFAGVVARRYVRMGQRVAANDKLFWVTATEPLRVHFNLPENYVGHLKNGERVNVTVPSSDATYQAEVVMISPVVDPGSGTLDVQAQIMPPTKGLLPGMSATIRIAERQ